MSELVTFGETMLRLGAPSGERLEQTHRLDVHVGGAESNVAVAAAALGADAAWVSTLPDSPLGRRVAGAIRHHGVEPIVTWSEQGRQGLYFLDAGGAPRGTDVIYDRRNAPIRSVTYEEMPLDRIDEADAVYVSGITPALSEPLAETTAALLAHGDVAAFDLNYRSKLWSPEKAEATYRELLGDVNLLFAAERDARSTLGASGSAKDIAGFLADEFDIDITVVTSGSSGAVAIADGDTIEQPAFDADTIDPIGTGDAFVGAFLARYLEGDSVATAMEYGAATAALKRTIRGDMAIISAADVKRVIEASITGGIDR